MYKKDFSVMGTADPVVTAAGTTVIDKITTANNGGGVTLNEAAVFAGAGTSTFRLIDLGTSGTVNGGTIATFAVAQAAAGGTVLTNLTYWLQAGSYIGLQTAAGTIVQPVRGWIVGQHGR